MRCRPSPGSCASATSASNPNPNRYLNPNPNPNPNPHPNPTLTLGGTTASPRRSTTRSSRANRRKAGRRPPWRASAHGTRRRLQTTASPTSSDGTTGRCLATDRRSTTLTRAHTGSRTPTLTLTPSPTLALALALTLTRHIWAQGVLRAEHPQGGLRPDATTLILPARAPPVEIARDCVEIASRLRTSDRGGIATGPIHACDCCTIAACGLSTGAVGRSLGRAP